MEEAKKSKFILINFRPLFCAFLGVIFGGILCFVLYLKSLPNLFLVFFVSFCCLFLIMLTMKLLKFKYLKNLISFCMVVFLGTSIGLGITHLKFQSMINFPLENGSYQIAGRAKSVNESSTSYSIILENVEIQNEKQDFDVYLTVDKTFIWDKFEQGNIITYNGYLSKVKLFNNSTINSNLSSNIKYYSSCKSVVSVEQGYKTITDNVKQKVKDTLSNNMQNDYANLSYSLLFGDKSNLDTDLYSLFRNCGIAHILAVSGLHIALICAILIFILKKCKCNSLVTLLVIALFLVGYSILCGFTASVCRASIMSVTYLVADIVGERKDMLSTFSLAGIIILLISPMQLFTIGFRLSFACVMGILMLSKPLDKLFSFVKLPNFIKSSFVITLSSTIATLPIISNTFGVFYPISFVSNLIILPIFTIAFTLLFVFTIINLLLPFGFLFTFVEHFFNIIVSLSSVLSLAWNIKLQKFSFVSILLYYVMVFIISPYVNLKISIKSVICLMIAVVVTINFIVGTMNKKYNEDIVFCGNITNFYVVTTSSNKNYIVGAGDSGEEYEFYNMKNMLIDKGILHIDGLILVTFDSKQQNNLENLLGEFDIKQIVASSDIDEDLLFGIARTNKDKLTVIDFESQYHLVDNLTLQSIKYDNKTYASVLNCGLKSAVLVHKDLTTNRINTIKSMYVDVVIINENKSQLFENSFINDTYFQDFMVKLKNV